MKEVTFTWDSFSLASSKAKLTTISCAKSLAIYNAHIPTTITPYFYYIFANIPGFYLICYLSLKLTPFLLYISMKPLYK